MPPNELQHISEVIGPKGRYQVLIAFTLLYTSAVTGGEIFYIQFLAPKAVLYWSSDELSPNRTDFDSDCCKMEDVTEFNFTSANSTSASKLIYESHYIQNTLTEKFNLVCERSWMISLLKSLSSVSPIFGNVLFGHLSEKFGRRRCLQGITVALCLANILALFAQNYIMFAVGYSVASMTACYSRVLSATNITEIWPSSKRSMIGPITQFGFIMGLCIIPGAAVVSKDWFYSQLLLVCLCCCLLPLTWYIQESPIWLMVKGRQDQAKESMLRIVKINQTEGTAEKVDIWLARTKEMLELQEQKKTGTFLDLFRNRIVTKYTCLLAIADSAVLFSSLGILMNVETFGSDLVQDYYATHAFTLMLLPVTATVIKRVSLKWSQVILFVLLGLSCGSYLFVYENSIGRMITTVLGRGIASPIINFNMAYTAEVFPTSVRVIGQSFVATCSSIFITATPFLKELGEKTKDYVPFIIFSALAFIGAIMFLFLPNTKNKPLVDTVQQLQTRHEEESNTKL